VVPVLDWGQDADSERYFLVMPVRERSLQDVLREKGVFSAKEAMGILIHILEGLSEVSDITHRDMKSSNVLWHEGAWKIADFGIAKFVEDSTK
jgi:serine/threonine-protein kinase